MDKTVIKLIRAYQKVAKLVWNSGTVGFVNSSCKFYPTCSDYSIDAISKYGPTKGLTKSIFRVLRCNPFSKGGIDEA